MYEPHSIKFGLYSQNDGTLDFYMRVGQLADAEKVYIDFGAGRGQWYEDDPISFRKRARHMQGRFKEVVGADIDPAVMKNNAVDRSVLMRDGTLPMLDQSSDVIVADYVIEHIENPKSFASEIDRLLKPGGWFCARTPHKLHYIAMGDRLIPESLAKFVLHRAQPGRKEEDVFPKIYKLNTMRDIAEAFPGWHNHSFIYRTDPGYFFGSRAIYTVADFFHRVMPAAFSGNLFIFLQKPL